MQIHPEFDVSDNTWFWQDYEAKTIPELCCKVGKGTTVRDYYPKGYLTSNLLTAKTVWLAPLGLPDTRMRVVTLGKPQQAPVKPPPSPKPRKPRTPPVERVADRMWLPDEVEVLCEGVNRGLSASQVALKLGRTKNSVMGRAKRMGLHFNGGGQW